MPTMPPGAIHPTTRHIDRDLNRIIGQKYMLLQMNSVPPAARACRLGPDAGIRLLPAIGGQFPAWIALVCLALLAGPALAQEPFHTAGEMRFDYDNVTVKPVDGPRKSSGIFGQSYIFSVGGPLMSENLGSAQAVFTHTRGENLAQVVDGKGSGGFQTTGMNLSSNLLNGDVKKYFTAAPFYDRKSTTAVWGDAPRTMIDTTTGATVGMTLPELPSVRVTHQVAERTGKNGEPFADAPGTTATNVASFYKAGPAIFEYNQERHTTAAAGAYPESGQDVVTARAALEEPNLNRAGVRGYNSRVEYFGAGNRGPVAGPVQRRLSQSGGFNTVDRKVGITTNYLSYSESVNHDLVRGGYSGSQETALVTGYRATGVDASNRIQHQYAPPGSPWMNRMADRQNLELNASGLDTRYSLVSEEGYAWSGVPGSGMDGREDQRVSLKPVKRVETWVQQAYAEGWGGQIPRKNRLLTGGGGVSVNPVDPLDLKLSYEHARNWIAAAGRRDTDRGTGEARVRPLDNLDFGASYTYEVDSEAGFGSASLVTATLTFDAGWSPLVGLRTDLLAQQVTRSGGGYGGRRPADFNLTGKASYSLGKTTASMLWESREFSSSSPYTRMSASLARAF